MGTHETQSLNILEVGSVQAGFWHLILADTNILVGLVSCEL